MRNARIEATACQTTSHDYQNDPRMKVVREFLWREVLEDTRDGHSGDEIYWLLAEGLLRSLDAAAWLPPETAPGFRTLVLIATRDGSVGEARNHYPPGEDGWVWDGSDVDVPLSDIVGWMPLPRAPEMKP